MDPQSRMSVYLNSSGPVYQLQDLLFLQCLELYLIEVDGEDKAFESTLPASGMWPGYRLVWHELKRNNVSSIV